LGFLPEEWFQLFYPKTGVTGPYLFGTGLVTYLYSKEILLMDHEFYVGITIAGMIVYTMKKFGPSIAKYLDDQVDEREKIIDKARVDTLNALQQAIKDEQHAQWQTDGQKILIEAKKENVSLQLESEFRRRQMQVFNEVKRRLDYQLEQVNIQRRLQQKHMVDWVVNNVVKSISPQQEKDMLAKCISDLKGLSAAKV
jgi:F-type H+-transporting ATPase subunit b